jgi:hypothetical protein
LSSDDPVELTNPRVKWQRPQENSRYLLNGNVEQIADDLRQIEETGVDLAILNYNRSLIGNSIDNIISVTGQLHNLVK